MRRLAQAGYVVVLDLHGSSDCPVPDSTVVHGDAGDPEVAAEAGRRAELQAPLMGWVNNAATFRDADLTSASASEITDAVLTNLRLAITGCHTAVDYGPAGIRTNAVALGSISTARYEAYRRTHPEADSQMAALHPLGRVGTSEEVADAVHCLLSPAAGFVNGVILPVDGGRAVLGADPESAP